jgi:hypothetical protein
MHKSEGSERVVLGKELKVIEILHVINKLDKEALNLYTRLRAYGWLEPGAASPGALDLRMANQEAV